jgi:LysR family transcriptional regulator, transcriptional activator of the cysJI operon
MEFMIENFCIKVFRTVAEQRHFRKAAELLYLTQPAVTHQIQALEETFSVPLFDRTGKEVALTASGEILLRYVRQVDEPLSRAEEEISALAGEVRGELRIAASMTIAQFALPGLLGGFVRMHPNVQVKIESAKTPDVIQAAVTQRAALGLKGVAGGGELSRWCRSSCDGSLVPRGAFELDLTIYIWRITATPRGIEKLRA